MNETYLFIFIEGFSYNTAYSNRVLALVKAIAAQNVRIKVISIGISPQKLPSINGVEFVELRKWKRHFRKADYYFQYFFSRVTLTRYIKILPQDASVILLNCRNYLHLFTKREDLKIYHEVTEHYRVVRTFMVRRYLKNCHHLKGLFVISTALKDVYQSLGLPADQIHIINMFADSSRFLNLRKEPVPHPYIAYCGDMSNTKDGVDQLVMAYSKIADKTALNLWLIGKYRGGLDEYIKEKGLDDRIIFTGLVDYQSMPQILLNATMLVLARPDSLQAANGFPTKLGEYLLTGNPVVITKVGDIPLFLEHKKSAMICESTDMDSFAENMLWVAEHYDEAREIGLRGKTVAESNFNSAIEVRKMIDVIFK